MWLVLGATGIAQPVPAKNTVLKPTFITGYESFTAGTAFVCDLPDGKGRFLLTAHHLLGPAGGFETELPWNKLNEVIKLTVALSMDDPTVHIVSRKALQIPGARALDRSGWADDLAAFHIDSDKRSPALQLAKTMPKPGERLWLYARQRGSDKLALFPCTAATSNGRELHYTFSDRAIKLAGTSGAPVLNAEGLIVAINIGGGEENGRLIGYGNPAPSVVAHLERATKP